MAKIKKTKTVMGAMSQTESTISDDAALSGLSQAILTLLDDNYFIHSCRDCSPVLSIPLPRRWTIFNAIFWLFSKKCRSSFRKIGYFTLPREGGHRLYYAFRCRNCKKYQAGTPRGYVGYFECSACGAIADCSVSVD